jgi:hypothetical protein
MSSLEIYKATRDKSRGLYYSHAHMKMKKNYEHQKQKAVDIMCSFERKSIEAPFNSPTMFIGDRGHCVGSRLKGHLKYGGHWKERKNHGRNTHVFITDEYNTSQTCVFCFQKLQHSLRLIENKSGKDKIVHVNGAFQCENELCISLMHGQASQGRDALSALAIGLKGLTTLLLGAPFPPLDSSLGPLTDEKFKELATYFSKKESRVC